jgi:hypothetical protein
MRKAVIIIVLFNLFRLVILPFIGLMPQDAYFTFYAEHLSLSYYDHPPLIGYFVFLFIEIFGKNILTVKSVAFVVTILSQLAFFGFSSRILRGQRKYLAWILFSTTLMVSSLSAITCPDVILILFWTLSLWCLYVAIFDKKWWGWFLAGLCMGLSFNSKYPAIALPSGLFLFLIFSNHFRKWLGTPWPYVAIIITILFTIPVFWWNAQNQFVSFGIVSLNRAEPFDGSTPSYFPRLALIQIALITPVIFIGLWWAMFKYFGRIFKKPNQVNPELWFLLCFFLPIYMGLYMVSVFGAIKYNWLLPTYISGIILLSRFLKYRWLKWHLGFTIAIHCLFYYLVLFEPGKISSGDLAQDWQKLSAKVDSIHQQYPQAFLFSADSYKTTSGLNFFDNDTIYGPQIIGQPAFHFGYIGLNLKELSGKDALMIECTTDDNIDSWSNNIKSASQHFNNIRELDPVFISGKHNNTHKYRIYYCLRYKE